MAERKLTIEHNGVTYTGYLATIKSTSLGWEDHGILTAFLHCEWPSSGVGVGGYGLDKFVERGQPRRGTAYGLDHIMRILETVGVNSWEKLPGKNVIVLFEGSGYSGSSVGIANALDDKILILKEHSAEWVGKANG